MQTVIRWSISLAGLVAFTTGCAHAPLPISIRLRREVERPPACVLIFFGDGLDKGRLRELVQAGQLPHIQRRFFEGGVEVEHAFSSLPSVTYPNCSSMITGVYPGHHGIMGNYWFDRYALLARYYMTLDSYLTVNQHLTQPTLYDMLHDRLTVSIQAHTHRGVTRSLTNRKMFWYAWVSGQYLEADEHVGESLEDVAEIANEIGRWPRVIMTYYPGIDEMGHRHGPNSPGYTEAITMLDQTVGNVTTALEEAGLGDIMHYVLIADHGMAPVHAGQDFDLIDWLRRIRGLRVRTKPLTNHGYEHRYEKMTRYDAVASVDAGRVAMIHLRGQNGWPSLPSPAEVTAWAKAPPALHELPAVGLIAARAGQDKARAWSRLGEVEVERRHAPDGLEYRLTTIEGDPLGYGQEATLAPFAAAGWHTSRAWLQATATSSYPDFVPQVVELFDSPHTGDLVIFAADGWALYTGEKAGHGSALARDMTIPLFVSGPGLPANGKIPYGRLVDVTPTILGLLGEANRLERFPPLDGIDLSDAIRHARPIDTPPAHAADAVGR